MRLAIFGGPRDGGTIDIDEPDEELRLGFTENQAEADLLTAYCAACGYVPDFSEVPYELETYRLDEHRGEPVYRFIAAERHP